MASSKTALTVGIWGDFSGRTGRGLMVLGGGRGRVGSLEDGVVVWGVNRRAVKGVRGGDGSTLGGGHLKIVFMLMLSVGVAEAYFC